MQFAPKFREDISRYYKGCFIKLKEYGDQLFFIETVDASRITGKHESGEQFVIYLDDDTPYEVDYILPHKSFFQLQDHAIQLQRVPAKQYSRGLCPANTQLSFLHSLGTIKTLPLNFDNLKQFVAKQKFFTLQGAIGANTCTTCALSSRMMYHRSKKEIFIDFTSIARVQPNKLMVIVTKPIFMDEVRELLQNNGEIPQFTVQEWVPPPPKEKTKTEDLLKEMGAPSMKKKAPLYAYMDPPDWAAPDAALDNNL